MFFSPDSLPRVKRSTGSGIIANNVYLATQTVTIPKGATKAFVRLVGAGGGERANGGVGCVAVAGSGGYLEKLLTGLVGGLTLALTVGAGGAAGGANNGGNTTLVSGSQSISTLTAGGGGGVNNAAASIVFGSNGTATGGDFNYPGTPGSGTYDANTTLYMFQTSSTPLSSPVLGVINSVTGNLGTPGRVYGGGGLGFGSASTSDAAGANGIAFIEWFS